MKMTLSISTDEFSGIDVMSLSYGGVIRQALHPDTLALHYGLNARDMKDEMIIKNLRYDTVVVSSAPSS